MAKKPENYDALYTKVREALKDRVYKTVAKKCYMTRETVRKIARGEASPKYSTLEHLADYMGVDRD